MKRLIILLLIVGCENPTTSKDCAGVTGGDAMSNECGYCVAGSTELHNNFCGDITDHDGNSYKTVKIGEQIWMAENLKVTSELSTDSAWCSYFNAIPCLIPLEAHNPTILTNESDEYGVLYSKNLLSYNICSEGWHLPFSYEFDSLFNFLGYDSTLSSKLMVSDNNYWGVESGSNNSSGFSVIPHPESIYNRANFWNKTLWDDGLKYDISVIDTYYVKSWLPIADNYFGFYASIRCVKD